MNIEPTRAEMIRPPDLSRPDRRTSAELRQIANRTFTRIARVHEETILAGEKDQALTGFTTKVMWSHALLERTRQLMADGDPLMYDDLGTYTSVAKVGRLENLVDLIYNHRRI